MCARGDEQRVEKLRIAVEGGITGAESDIDDVLASHQFLAGNHDMPVDGAELRRLASDGEKREVLGAWCEVGPRTILHEVDMGDRVPRFNVLGGCFPGKREGIVVEQTPEQTGKYLSMVIRKK